MLTRNRENNLFNPYQTSIKKVLCVCSAGLLRSPTAANVLHQEFGYNTRAAGLAKEYALVIVDEALLVWSDEIVVMEDEQVAPIMDQLDELDLNRPVVTLRVPDRFEWNHPELRKMIKDRYIEEMDGEV